MQQRSLAAAVATLSITCCWWWHAHCAVALGAQRTLGEAVDADEASERECHRGGKDVEVAQVVQRWQLAQHQLDASAQHMGMVAKVPMAELRVPGAELRSAAELWLPWCCELRETLSNTA